MDSNFFLQIDRPELGTSQTYTLAKGQDLYFSFDEMQADFTADFTDLIINFPDNSSVRIEGYLENALSGDLTSIQLQDGTNIAGNTYVDSFDQEVRDNLMQQFAEESIAEKTLSEEGELALTNAEIIALSGDPDANVSVESIRLDDPSQGEVAYDSDTESWYFMPARDFFGEMAFSYTLKDENGELSEGSSSLTVEAVNDPPELDLNGENPYSEISFVHETAGFQNIFGVYQVNESGRAIAPQVLIVNQNAGIPEGHIIGTLEDSIDYHFFVIADGAREFPDLASNRVSFNNSGDKIELLVDGESIDYPVYFSQDSENPDTLDGRDPDRDPAPGHFIFEEQEDGTTLVGIEDLPDGGDNDYSDIVIRLTPVEGHAGSNYEATFIEDTGAVSVASAGILINDVDNSTMSEAVIILHNTQDGDELRIGHLPENITAEFSVNDDGSLLVKLTGLATSTEYQSAIRAVAFYNTSDDPDTADRFITASIKDADGLESNVAQAVIHVEARVDAPDVVGEEYSLEEDQSLVLTFDELLANDSDVDTAHENLGIIPRLETAENGSLTVDNEARTVTFTPDENYSGEASFKYYVTDGSFLKTGLVNIDVTPVNDAPTVGNIDARNLSQGDTLVIDTEEILALAQDIDSPQESLFVAAITLDDPSQGDINYDEESSSWIFTPAPDFLGDVSFTYIVKDDLGGRGQGQGEVTVIPHNEAPEIDLDGNMPYSEVSFVSESAGFSSIVGMYQVDENGQAVNPQLLIHDNNAGIPRGHILGSMEDDIDYQFFIIADGAKSYSDLDASQLSFDTSGEKLQLLIDGESAGHPVYFSQDSENPDTLDGRDPDRDPAPGHFLYEEQSDGSVLVGIEDLPDGGDNDYRDVVLKITSAENSDGTGYETTFVEDVAPVSIASGGISIVDNDSPLLSGASILLTNTKEADQLQLGHFPENIAAQSSIDDDGNILVELTGNASAVEYQSAIRAISFYNDSETPNTDDRIIEVSVKDDNGFQSNLAQTTITIIPRSEAPDAMGEEGTLTKNSSITFSFDELLENESDLDTAKEDLQIIPIGNGVRGSMNVDYDAETITFTAESDYVGKAFFQYRVTDGENKSNVVRVNLQVKDHNSPPHLDLDGDNPYTEVSFLSESAGYSSIVGVYQIGEDGEVMNPQVLINNQNAGIPRGHVLGTLDDSNEYHFFIVANGAHEHPDLADSQLSFDTSGDKMQLLVDGEAFAAPVYFSQTEENPDGAEHFRIEPQEDGTSRVLIEDLPNGGDQDFNDIVLQLEAGRHNGATTGHNAKFIEDTGSVSIASAGIVIRDVDEDVIGGAKIVLQNTHDGDELRIGHLPEGIEGQLSFDESANIVISLSGLASSDDYQDALQAISFYNSSETPNTDDRLIEVSVFDREGLESNLTYAEIEVEARADAPVAVGENGVVQEDGSITFTIADLLSNDSDSDSDHADLQFIPIGNGVRGEMITDMEAGTVTFVPEPDYNGKAFFQYRVSDGRNKSNVVRVNLEVEAANDDPVVGNLAQKTLIDEDHIVISDEEIIALASDIDLTTTPNAPDILFVEDLVLDDPSQGHLEYNEETAEWSFYPNANFLGVVHYSYTVSDGQGGSATGRSSIDVVSISHPPETEDFSLLMGGDEANINFSPYVSDVEDDLSGEALQIMLLSLPEKGQLVDKDGNILTQADIDGKTLYDVSELEYVPEQLSVFLGNSQAPPDIRNWGEEVDASTRLVTVNEEVSVIVSAQGGDLTQYNEEKSHVGFGLGVGKGFGINSGEVLSIEFDGAEVRSAEIYFDGLGGHFIPDADGVAKATAPWIAYLGDEVVASGEVTNVSAGLEQVLELDHTFLNGQNFDRIEFSTNSASGSNWELRSVNAQFAHEDEFEYLAVDSDGHLGNSSTVDIHMVEGDIVATIGKNSLIGSEFDDVLVVNSQTQLVETNIGNDIILIKEDMLNSGASILIEDFSLGEDVLTLEEGLEAAIITEDAEEDIVLEISSEQGEEHATITLSGVSQADLNAHDISLNSNDENQDILQHIINTGQSSS